MKNVILKIIVYTLIFLSIFSSLNSVFAQTITEKNVIKDQQQSEPNHVENKNPKTTPDTFDGLVNILKKEEMQSQSEKIQTKTKTKTKKKNAIMTIHYEGTKKDDEYVLAIRVLMKSVLDSKTTADRVVIASKNVRQSTIDTFKSDGLLIRFVENIKNPYHEKGKKTSNFKSHFEFTLNKLFLWNYEEYNRIIYFDADNIVLNNLNDVFMCGHFCAVFMNPVYFHTGMLVIKPNVTVFNDMLQKLAVLQSYDGADQGFLTAYFENMDNARLFDPREGQSEAHMNRLAIGYNMHHLYYYEKMNWDLYARGWFKSLPGDVPAYTIGYPISPPLKPWYWWSYLLLDNHWEFYKIRKTLNESWEFSFFWRFTLMFCIVVSSSYWLPTSILGRSEDVMFFLLLKLGDSFVSFFLGFCALILSCYIAGVLVPPLMPPPLAWTLFICYNNGLMFIFARMFSVVCKNRNLYSSIFHNAVPAALLQGLTFYLSTAKIYSDPALKIILCLFLIITSSLYKVRPFRTLLRKVTLRRKSSLQHPNRVLPSSNS